MAITTVGTLPNASEADATLRASTDGQFSLALGPLDVMLADELSQLGVMYGEMHTADATGFYNEKEVIFLKVIQRVGSLLNGILAMVVPMFEGLPDRTVAIDIRKRIERLWRAWRQADGMSVRDSLFNGRFEMAYKELQDFSLDLFTDWLPPLLAIMSAPELQDASGAFYTFMTDANLRALLLRNSPTNKINGQLGRPINKGTSKRGKPVGQRGGIGVLRRKWPPISGMLDAPGRGH